MPSPTGVAKVNWEEDTFAYAEAYDEESGRYRGITVGEHVSPRNSSAALIIKPERAKTQLSEEEKPDDGPGVDRDPEPQPEAHSLPTRFYGRATLDPVRAVRDLGKIVEEVVNHLGSNVTITVEVEARGDGFSERDQRTVSENANQLGFDDAEVEK